MFFAVELLLMRRIIVEHEYNRLGSSSLSLLPHTAVTGLELRDGTKNLLHWFGPFLLKLFKLIIGNAFVY